jgi:hypothetical protein
MLVAKNLPKWLNKDEITATRMAIVNKIVKINVAARGDGGDSKRRHP